MLLLAGALVGGGDVYDAVGINVKGNFDLRNTATGRSNAVQMELAQRLVVGSHLALALEHMDFHGSLVVCSGGEDLALLGGNSGVTLNELGEHAAHGLNAQAQRGHVQQ